MSITSTDTTTQATCQPRTILRQSSYIDAEGNITVRRRRGVFGTATNILERKCSTHDAMPTVSPHQQRLSAKGRGVAAGLFVYVMLLGLLAVHLSCPTWTHAQSIVTFASDAACSSSSSSSSYISTAFASVEEQTQQATAIPPVPAIKEKKAEKKQLQDDNKALQVAFETDFTCQEVVVADATQCDEEDDQGRTVRFFCPVSCSKATSKKPVAPTAPKEITDGLYNNYNAQFEQCAAVGSEQDSCTSSDSRGEGCACQASSQCGAIQGANCCYQGFCSYEHLAPLDPCM